ncbi:MAG: tRNA preQ1(34) S-adenosylmethionine ribosyltransferase-isomerase QueA [Planctomycetes bacterium]|nr:tRNA preQ1(34) S-adenosylmethionine ribosyltransferase-isomerase QueA [Planctomycetota bacterium]
MTELSDYDFELPEELIAQEPAPSRSGSRALFLVRQRDGIELGHFAELGDRLRGDECLVVNDTRVIPARIPARRATGASIEVFLLRPEDEGAPDVWRAWVSPAKRVRPPESLEVRDGTLEVLERVDSFFRVRVGGMSRVEALGEVPLPPYIRRSEHDPRRAADRERYQTLFARRPGAVAAPTAGLHFSPELLASLEARGIPVIPVTLHVGPGTFKPITADRLLDHRVDPELFEVSEVSRSALARARAEGRRIVTVGTTSTRVLESLESLDAGPNLAGETALTILPGHPFRHVDGLITNFHLPRSSLLVLVSSFHGRERTLDAYRAAIARRLRFYSYGDAMVILPDPEGPSRC